MPAAKMNYDEWISYCDICSEPIKGLAQGARCTICGRGLCIFCQKKLGGFLGFGGKTVCPYCYNDAKGRRAKVDHYQDHWFNR